MNSSQPPCGAASRLICTLPSACAETYFPCELLSVIFPPGRSSIWKYSHVLATSRFHCALPSGCALRNFPCTLRRAICAIASPPTWVLLVVETNQFFGEDHEGVQTWQQAILRLVKQRVPLAPAQCKLFESMEIYCLKFLFISRPIINL